MSLKITDVKSILNEVLARISAAPEVHPSFAIELANYSRRLALRDLDSKEMRIVIEGFAENALAKKPKRLDAYAVRTIAFELCDDPFGLCETASRAILRDKNMHGSASKIDARLLKMTELLS